ncbi:MAG: hypothetical protein QF415_15785 [Candidatus Undinarchaeales archaeon]|jgi:hypothetical protein|nr:hypothetical protein [Candidatus Undinarchaeales archaeon]MDP7492546.1 hypothetical protein [Candidatus Undinarchaeales archaeon]
MDAEVILNYNIMGLDQEAYDTLDRDLDSALEDACGSYDIEVKQQDVLLPYTGFSDRKVIIRGSEQDVLEATQYLVNETKAKGYDMPLNSPFDICHPIAAWKGFRLSSYVLDKEKGADVFLDAGFNDENAEARMEELGTYAVGLAEKHGIKAKAQERYEPAYGGYPAVPPPSKVNGFWLSLDGPIDGVESALREAREHFDEKPEYLSDPLHPFKSFRGKNVAKVVELEDRE